jgi:hypothetical protein
MKLRPLHLAPSFVVFGPAIFSLTLLGLSVSCFEAPHQPLLVQPPHQDMLLHADPNPPVLPDPQPEFHPE